MIPPRLAFVSMVAVNLVPLAGVLAFHWDLSDLMVLYWLEYGFIGALTVLRMLGGAQRGRAGADRWADRRLQVPLFVVHYGLSWLFLGALLVTLFTPHFDFDPLIDGLAPLSEMPRLAWSLDVPWLRPSLLALIGSHLLSTAGGRRSGAGRRLGLRRLALQPYRRLRLHLALLLGAVIVAAFGMPASALPGLVLLKIGLDVVVYRRERARAAESRVEPVLAL